MQIFWNFKYKTSRFGKLFSLLLKFLEKFFHIFSSKFMSGENLSNLIVYIFGLLSFLSKNLLVLNIKARNLTIHK
jgi:hypothetical protein